jgi:hypothetical protein
MGTSDAQIALLARGVAKGVRIAPKVLAAPMVVAVIRLLAPPALQERLFTNLALPEIELRVAIRRAERLVLVIGWGR